MKNKKVKKCKINDEDYSLSDCGLPEPPKIQMFETTFGSVKDITEEWYKENRE